MERVELKGKAIYFAEENILDSLFSHIEVEGWEVKKFFDFPELQAAASLGEDGNFEAAEAAEEEFYANSGWTPVLVDIGDKKIKLIGRKKMESTVITLSNGLRVANLNSPHEFIFEDGSVLPAVSAEFARKTQLTSKDVEAPSKDGKFTVVKKVFEMSKECQEAIDELQMNNLCDIIIAPLPVVLMAIEKGWIIFDHCKLYTCFLTDRITKTVSISKFCR